MLKEPAPVGDRGGSGSASNLEFIEKQLSQEKKL